MYKLNHSIKISILVVVITFFSSCFKDLDTEPFYGLNSASVYKDPANYIHVLAKLYGGLSLTGNKGPAGTPDISSNTIDEGFSNYVRVLWNLQELPTDEAICGWNDPGIPELNFGTWSSETIWIKGMYYRIYYQLTLCNEFIRQASDANLSERGFAESDKTAITNYRNEARFLRALSYYHLLDLFGSGPFITDAEEVGANLPRQAFAQEIFNYVESELKAIEGSLPAPKQNQYGRADQAAVWTLLAKLYLNAEANVGTARYADAATYAKKVIDANTYTLEPTYQHLFLADNHLSNEIIFAVPHDGLRTQTYGGTTFLVHAAIGGSMQAANFGVNGGWQGLRAKKALPTLFADTLDTRFIFHTPGQQLDVDTIAVFRNGYGVAKWKNVDRNGVKGSDPSGDFVDTDFPMFRLGDVYLMYAEAVTRGGGGDAALALQLVNQLRERAYGNSTQHLSSLTLNNLLDERGRELYWEGQRRTDLIRFGKFTGTAYTWEWKGGAPEGSDIPAYRKVFPIPAADLVANPNLKQNTGY